ncbi:hypothetical protein FO519_000189 [Halicephalobus sp. NKZ332]|nr:hypothetical protein FO519_000189 [Halicephalobus sp. NKZ332]
MADDAILNDDDLLGVDDTDLLEDELDESLLDDEVPLKKSRTSNDGVGVVQAKTENIKLKEDQPCSSIEKLGASTSLDNEALDYEDDLDEFDEKERRESKFESERGDKATKIESILPQQKGQRSGDNENTTSERGRGGHRGRHPGRGNWRGRGGFRPPGPFPMFGDRPPAMLPNGMPFIPNPGFPPYPPMPQFPPFLGPGGLPQQMPPDPTNWNKRVEAFMRRTADSVPNRARDGRLNNDRKSRDHKKPQVDEKKAALECAEAIGLDEEYLKKVEEQKRLREEIQRKKLKKIQDVSGEEPRKPDEKQSRKRSRSPERRSRGDRSRHRHHHHRKHRRERASSLERLAEQALKAANAAIMPTGSGVPPGVPIGVNPMASLPPMNIPPPTIPIQAATAMGTVDNHQVKKQVRPVVPEVPVVRTVSTATIAGPLMPKIVKYQPPPDAKEKNLKAHLVVVVGNIGRLQNAFKRITLFASSVGDTKKVWQTDPNSVSMIFKKLEDAKTFLNQYHNQTIAGIRLEVSLHKMYLNLDAMS